MIFSFWEISDNNNVFPLTIIQYCHENCPNPMSMALAGVSFAAIIFTKVAKVLAHIGSIIFDILGL